jgi:hypothetical protein
MKLDDVKKLHQKKYRSQFGFYLVEGEHLVQELPESSLMAKTVAQSITLYVTALQITLVIFTAMKREVCRLTPYKR